MTYVLHKESNNFCANGETPTPILSTAFCLTNKLFSILLPILLTSKAGNGPGDFLGSSMMTKSCNKSVFMKLILQVSFPPDELGNSFN